MTRDPELIEGAELLYRAISTKHVDADAVSFRAIDMDGMSCQRSKYCAEPRDACDGRPAAENGVAQLIAANMPKPIVSGGGVTWEFFAADAPEEGRDAHAEVRTRRLSDRPSLAHVTVSNSVAKQKMRVALAGAMTIRIAPVALDR